MLRENVIIYSKLIPNILRSYTLHYLYEIRLTIPNLPIYFVATSCFKINTNLCITNKVSIEIKVKHFSRYTEVFILWFLDFGRRLSGGLDLDSVSTTVISTITYIEIKKSFSTSLYISAHTRAYTQSGLIILYCFAKPKKWIQWQ